MFIDQPRRTKLARGMPGVSDPENERNERPAENKTKDETEQIGTITQWHDRDFCLVWTASFLLD